MRCFTRVARSQLLPLPNAPTALVATQSLTTTTRPSQANTPAHCWRIQAYEPDAAQGHIDMRATCAKVGYAHMPLQRRLLPAPLVEAPAPLLAASAAIAAAPNFISNTVPCGSSGEEPAGADCRAVTSWALPFVAVGGSVI